MSDTGDLSLDEARSRRLCLIDEMEGIRLGLGAEKLTVIARSAMRQALQVKESEVRRINERIRELSNETTWRLLARCHVMIEALAGSPSEEVDTLLDAIEATIPKRYLETA